ncbi:BglII/BstYI family type II restriction endonuclease [Bacillus cereus]|uniref:BglII/BstYI family type II restriction endonuclease n=1 Tax=Bacillus cereus TaxID=1396 RepID=UPI00236553C4|nr:BglII/BstYI family type II restriction endonuclease [Bacillus cereus]MDD8000015.1 BglII/BstYI family type II restriction endonuclease [Bacillus cereus]
MQYKMHSFRYGEELFSYEPEFVHLWKEIKDVLDSITEEDLIQHYNNNPRVSKKSISDSINDLIDCRLSERKWERQSPIFNNSEYRPTSRNRWWTLDFAKDTISIEVAFNHGEAVAWNLIKPVLAGELNHVEKAIQTKAGVLITATDLMKKAGNFDNSIGTYEKFLQYLNPFRNILTVPLVIIGLEPPKTFKINKKTKKVELL